VFRRMMIIGAVLFAALTLAMAAPAHAQDEAPSEYDNVAGDSEVNDDGSVTVTGENCPPNSTVTYEVESTSGSNQGEIVDSGSTTADADGEYEFTTDPLPNGRYEIRVTCGGETTVLAVNVNRGQATAPGRSAAGALPTTGTDSSIPLARLGVILVASGGVAMYAAKKRNGRRAAFISN
jgi:hypothetical protein